MSSPCLIKSFCFAAAAVLPVRADILPPDSHLVPRTVAVVNTGDFPAQAFVALEFYPGQPSTPVAATYLGPGIEAKIRGYKLDRMQVYAAKASEWPEVKARLGLALAKSASASPCPSPDAAGSGAGCADSSAADWRSGLTLVPGDLEASPRAVPNSSNLVSEAYRYRLEGRGPDGLILSASLQTYADGSKKEIPMESAGLKPPVGEAPMARLAADGRSLIWVPGHAGVAAISLVGADGRRAWSARRVAAAGKPQSIALPGLPAGRYLLSAQGRGWSQRAWLDFGGR